jgi:hypothetical protein
MGMIGGIETGELLTRGTVWVALCLYVAGEVVRASNGSGTPVRWCHTAGCAAFLAHVVCAFGFYHHWSHAAAFADTARQTAQFTGWNWGGGLYVNYAFGLVWLGETVWSWVHPAGYPNRPKWIIRTLRGFFLFMIFNGAVVFVRGWARWFGLTLCLFLALCWWPRKGRRQP